MYSSKSSAGRWASWKRTVVADRFASVCTTPGGIVSASPAPSVQPVPDRRRAANADPHRHLRPLRTSPRGDLASPRPSSTRADRAPAPGRATRTAAWIDSWPKPHGRLADAGSRRRPRCARGRAPTRARRDTGRSAAGTGARPGPARSASASSSPIRISGRSGCHDSHDDDPQLLDLDSGGAGPGGTRPHDPGSARSGEDTRGAARGDASPEQAHKRTAAGRGARCSRPMSCCWRSERPKSGS